MNIDKETIIAILTTFSAIISGFMLYRSNISKDKTKTYIETLEAEGDFREELIKIISDLKLSIQKINKENERLRDELYLAKIQIKNLEMMLSEKLNKCKILENFLRHLTSPAWVMLNDNYGKFKLAFVNFSFCNYFNVSTEYCIGKEDFSFLSEDIKFDMNTICESVTSRKMGMRDNILIGDKIWTIFKFPIIEDGETIGLGGILIHCGEV
jgi:hypothetical protein